MQLFALVLSGIVILISPTTATTDYCYSTDKNPYLFFGTKTAYYVTQQDRKPLPKMQGCVPMQIWIVARHGTRYPQKKAVERMQQLSQFRDQIISGKNELCKEDLALLKNWKVNQNMVTATAGLLTRQGEKDMELFGSRIRSTFPDLFKAPVNAQNYKFRASKTERTDNSMLHFMQGIFKSKSAVIPEPVPDVDILLNPFKTCPAWALSLITDQVNRAAEKFMSTPEYKKLVENVSKRLGIAINIDSESAKSVKMLYDTCRFEKSWETERTSAWCAVFSKEELQILEYYDDLDHYYESGPGRDINKKLGCPLLQDMFTHFKNLENAARINNPKGIFYFTHTSIVQTVMTALGIGKDLTPISDSNYASMTNRKFRTSNLVPFAANVDAVFYRCVDKQIPNKVLFMVNEKPVDVEGCKNGICDWEVLKQKFGRVATCDPTFCQRKSRRKIKL